MSIPIYFYYCSKETFFKTQYLTPSLRKKKEYMCVFAKTLIFKYSIEHVFKILYYKC